MSDYQRLIAAAVVGLAAGFVYFGGLWYTVRRVVATQSAWLLLASWVVRTLVLLVGVWLATSGQWQRVVVCLAGVLVARSVVFRLTAAVPPEGEPA